MIPVHEDALISFDINNEEDERYKRLLQKQIIAINRMKADVLSHAHDTYFDVVEGTNTFLTRISCNFRKLEVACKSYDKNYVPKIKNNID